MANFKKHLEVGAVTGSITAAVLFLLKYHQ